MAKYTDKNALRMRFKGAFARNEVFITPAFGIINEGGSMACR